MIITGYRIKSTELIELESKLKQVKNILQKTSSEIYHKQLGEEIAFLCDNIALNILPREFQGKTIFERAVDNVNQMVHIAEITAAPAEYNLQVYVHLMCYDGYTYFKVICPNTKLLKAFKHLEPYSLSEVECQDKRNHKTVIWQKLHGMYENSEPLSLNLTQHIIPDREKISFPEKKDRCATLARHNEINHLLNLVSGGQQIQPFMLMRYMDTALEMLFQDDVKHSLSNREMELQKILPDLSGDISFIYGEEDKKPDSAEEKGTSEVLQNQLPPPQGGEFL